MRSRLNRLALIYGVAAASPALSTPDVVNLVGRALSTGQGWEYSYSIFNDSDFDLFIFSIEIPGNSFTTSDILGEHAPEGFDTQFDPDFGFVDFIGNTNFIAPGEQLGGFGFSSPYGPTQTAYSITGLDFLTGEQITFTGTTLAPAVPVPASSALIVIGAGIASRRRRCG